MQEGIVLCDRYRLDQSLGRGGMSDVYRAFDQRRRAYVAIKVLREDLAEDPDFVRRFAREAEALARLDHPNIVRFYNFEQEGAQAFIVMDFVSGSTLSRRLREMAGPLPLDEITHILRHVGAALHFAHQEGYIHRDVKPGNIMLRDDGSVLLSDFGIARATEAATSTMGPAGTPAYMSPEQILGHDLTPGADVYSLGVVLFEMATGERPFSGDVGTGTSRIERVRDAHLHAEPPHPQRINPNLPRAAAAVILRALAKSADRRYQDVTSLVQAWEDALGLPHELPAGGRLISIAEVASPKTERPVSTPAPATPVPPPPPPESPKRSRRGLVVALIAVVLLGAAAALFFTIFQPGAGRAAQAPTVVSPTADLATATPIPPTPDINATSDAKAIEIATRAAAATSTQAAMFLDAKNAAATEMAATATAESGATMTAVAAASATAEADARATETVIARATQDALALDATSTAVAEATAAVVAAATRSAQATAQVKAAAAATAKAATAIAISKQRPGLIFDFERDYTWKRGDEPYGQFARSTDQVKAGSSSGKLQYDFPAVAKNYVVFTAKPALAIPGQATGITAWVYGNGSNHFLNVWVQDAAGEVRAYTFGQIKHQGWQQMTAWLDETRGWPNGHISGADDGRLTYPAHLYAVVLDGVPDGQGSSGAIYLDDLFSTQDSIPAAAPTAVPYVPPAANAAPAPAASSGMRFQLVNGGQCAPNAGTSYYEGVVQHRDSAPYNGVCLHTAFNGPRNTKCTGCGIGDGRWSFSPFGGPAPSGISVQVYVVSCPPNISSGGINDNFGDLTPLSDVWTHTFGQSEQCTGITFVGD